MSGHECKSDPCTRCEDMVDAAVEARTGMPRGYTQRDLDFAADAQAANEWAGRDF